MNSRIILALLAVISLAAAAPSASADAGVFENEIVQASDQPLQITVGERKFVRIVNFVQEGGGDRGLVAVTHRNGKAAFVLSAAFANETEVQKDFIVAGPATITVNPVPNAKLFISYRVSKNG